MKVVVYSSTENQYETGAEVACASVVRPCVSRGSGHFTRQRGADPSDYTAGVAFEDVANKSDDEVYAHCFRAGMSMNPGIACRIGRLYTVSWRGRTSR